MCIFKQGLSHLTTVYDDLVTRVKQYRIEHETRKIMLSDIDHSVIPENTELTNLFLNAIDDIEDSDH